MSLWPSRERALFLDGWPNRKARCSTVVFASIGQQERRSSWTWAGKTILFITHDLEEAIALSDEVVLSVGPASRIVGRYCVDLRRPRNLIEFQDREAFWRAVLREEVLKSYDQRQE